MVLVGFDVSHGNLKFETVISSVIKAYRDWMATPPLRPPAPVLISLAIEERVMVGWIFATGLLSRSANHGLGIQILVADAPARPFLLLQRQLSDVFPPSCLRSRIKTKKLQAVPSWEWEWEWEGIETGGGGRTMNAQECGMPPRRAAPSPRKTARHLVFRTLNSDPDPGLRPSRRRARPLTTAPHCMAT